MSDELRDVLATQRRQRRLRFWLGLGVLLLVGSLWAGLSKDPIGNGFDDVVIQGAEVVEDAPVAVEEEELDG